MALLKEFPDAQDVFCGPEIVFHMKKDVELDKTAVRDALKKHKVKLASLKKDAEYIL